MFKNSFFDTVHLLRVLYMFNSKCQSFKIQAGIVDTLSWTLYIHSRLLEIEVYVAIWLTFLLVYDYLHKLRIKE